MSSLPVINHPCTICSRPTSMWCSRCQETWYCSPEHLQNDWPRHRKECTPHTRDAPYPMNVIATPPPAEVQRIQVSGIAFVPGEERARIVNVSCRPSMRHTNNICPEPLIGEFFGSTHAESIVLTQGLNGETLRFPLHLWYAPTALQSGAPVNHAIRNITNGHMVKDWCGPVVVLKFNGARRQGYADAGSNDLPTLSAYFLAYR